jgi:hypothetical protein
MLLRNPGRPRDAPRKTQYSSQCAEHIVRSVFRPRKADQRVALARRSVASIVPRPETSGFRIVQYRVTGPRRD